MNQPSHMSHRTAAHRRLAICLLLLSGLGLSAPMQGKGRLKQFLLRTDSVLSTRYRNAKIDTLYITRPPTKWTAKARLNVSGATVATEGKSDGTTYASEMKADYKSTLSAAINYLGVSVALSLNPAKLLGRYNDYEYNLNSYSNRMGFDVIYQDAHNFTGWHEVNGGGHQDLPPDITNLRTLNLNAYYAFNGRRFSYPAAFTQSFIQRRSAGSFLLAASFQGQEAKVETADFTHLKVMNFALGGGYGYNYVPAPNWLLHISALPTLIVYTHTSLTFYGTRMPMPYHFPEVIITGRGAVVRQIGRCFAGVSMVFNFTDIGNKNKLKVENTKWRTRIFFGFRF